MSCLALTSNRSARIGYCGLFGVSLIVSWILREVAASLLKTLLLCVSQLKIEKPSLLFWRLVMGYLGLLSEAQLEVVPRVGEPPRCTPSSRQWPRAGEPPRCAPARGNGEPGAPRCTRVPPSSRKRCAPRASEGRPRPRSRGPGRGATMERILHPLGFEPRSKR
ncbi:hypothetical protein Salat_0867400 [Sesamum alatum]|uniref:Uncharacterized protein n=1 Tax=Sesamum alatum TaxID=300844 RepID=A0AAE1YIS9_9LAMI|nr:hypothetical protein Salat_0867400 [Sesamum alatum]